MLSAAVAAQAGNAAAEGGGVPRPTSVLHQSVPLHEWAVQLVQRMERLSVQAPPTRQHYT